MMTSNERSGLTEPLESVTRFFGALMIIAALVGVAFLVFGSGGTYGGLPGNVCVTQPGTSYNSSDWNNPFVTARPGHSASIIGSISVCADHASLGEQTLGVVAALPAVLFWGGLLFMLWRIMVTAQERPFHAAGRGGRATARLVHHHRQHGRRRRSPDRDRHAADGHVQDH